MVSLRVPARLPPPTGPHAVGRMEFDWIDQSRLDPLSPGKQNREIDVFLWYPAERPGTRRATYLRDNWRRNLGLPFPWPTYIGIQTHSWEDASAIRTEGAPWPVVILSHGRGEVPVEYTSLAEQLASDGYIVASPTNTYAGPTVVFPDGRIVKSEDDTSDLGRLLDACAGDIGTVLKQLAMLNEDSRSVFFQRIDLKRAGLSDIAGAARLRRSSAPPTIGALPVLISTAVSTEVPRTKGYPSHSCSCWAKELLRIGCVPRCSYSLA